MARRTQIFQKIPWTGGVNTSVDPGVLDPNKLVQADNCVFSVAGTRIKRDSLNYFDSDLPAVATRSSSGTTRTLVFASDVTSASDMKIVVGEKLTIANAGNSNYNTTAAIVASVSGATITYTFSGASSLTEGSTAATSTTVARNYDIIGLIDLWYFDSSSDTNNQQLFAVTSQGLMFRYNSSGQRIVITKNAGATSLVADPTTCDLIPFNNKLIITLSGVGNTPKLYTPTAGTDEWTDLSSTAPDASIGRVFQGRLFLDDKTRKDFIHYSETMDETKWQGTGDSGGLPIYEGDGDPIGISAIFPPFKGRLIIAKGTKRYQMLGDSPETYFFSPLSEGVGAISHRAALAVEDDDIYHLSRRGAHSVVATDAQFGDFSGRYLSQQIQPTFNSWNLSKLNLSQGVYLQRINSAAWIVAEDGNTKPNAVWLYNPTLSQEGEWYRWPALNAQSIAKRLFSDQERVVMGNNAGRILYADPTLLSDEGVGISVRIKSGTIYVDGNSQTLKAFKKFGLLYKPRGDYSFTAYFKVDDFPVQALSFSQAVTGDVLGTTFVLGTSILGSESPLAPFMKDVYGHGRGCSIEIFQSGTDSEIEIYGYIIEYEPLDIADEVSAS